MKRVGGKRKIVGVDDVLGTSTLFYDLFQFGNVFFDFVIADGVVLEVTVDELFVGGHIHESVSAEVEEEDTSFPFLFAEFGFADGSGDGVAAFRSGDDAFCAGEKHACFERFDLRDVDAVHHIVFD